MISYIIRRLLIFIPTLLVIITVSFFIMKLAPGSPFDGARAMSPEIKANILKSYGLDKPLYIQYFTYLGNILKGDFGPSLKMKDFTVTELIMSSAPNSIILGSFALIIAFIFGFIIGSVSALKQNTKTDYILMSFAMFGFIIPSYALAPIVTLIFSVYLGWFPVAGWFGPNYAILPIILVSLPYICIIARLTRSSMLDVLNTNYIKTAYAKGLDEKTIIFKHAFKPTLLPVVSFLGPAAAGILTGSVVIEKVFDIPGLGRYFVQASFDRDYTLSMGILIFYAFLIITFNLIVDIVSALLDPKIDINS